VCVVAKRAADRRHGAEFTVRDHEGKDGRRHRRHSRKDGLPFVARMTALEAWAAKTPLIRDAGGQILQPTEPATGEITTECRGRGHREMPFEEQTEPLVRRIVAPPGILRADRQHPVDQRRGFGQTRQEAANAVADDEQRSNGLTFLREADGGVPVPPAIAASSEAFGP
jgi:hypothetical protein